VEEREEVGFDMAGDGVVVSLEDGRKDTAVFGLDIVDLLDCRGFEVGEPELV
jgi:hypothetical protein